MSVTALVDDREPDAVAAAVRAHPDVAAVDVCRLDAGDIVIGAVGFERKAVGDYLGSALGRTGTDLEAQVAALDEACEHAYVLVEGTWADLEAHWPGVAEASIRGSAASVTARFGVPVVPCGDLERLVDVAVRLARKHAEAPSARPLPTSAVPSRAEPVAKRMYGCIDGVGPTTAQALYEAFPTVESLVAADESELLAIEGVGPTRAEAIRVAFREPE
ncbi:helix-hairpin-helix domain-containing protein [Halosimplex sp. J119]